MYAFLGCYLAIQLPLKSLPGACDVTSLSPCTDSSQELQDLQQFMSEQIDLHVFKAITGASCVDIIVNKRLTISASTIISTCSTMFYHVVTMHNRINYKV